ncbi:MAG TPA: sulfatase-like hydrolase/transferase, partial [Armatimonadota bacterium]|nr:sulfatase-like hydrolase/transferase [Armatimonadota bacterium]
LLTGRYPIRAGVPGNVGPDNGLPTDQVTMAEMMRDAGYRTALFGKWHLGHRPGMLPLDQGFDEFYGHRGGCIDNYSHFFYWNGPNRHDLWRNNEEVWEDGRYFPDLVVREARRFMAENAERPFFLYLPFNIPHYPLQGKAKYRRMYEGLDAPRSEYAALVSTLDEKVGEVVGKVDQLGLREDTLIVFISDHGHSTEVRTHGGGGYAGDYRGSKFSLWEGGLRVPAVASLPGVIPENEVRDQACMSMDWLPTIAELTGATLPARRLDGRSLAPVLKSDDAPAPRDVMHWQQGMQWAARDGDWKLVVNGVGAADDEKEFLSDLSRDATERKNIAREHPEAVARLRGLHEGWAEDVKVQ